ncbi:MAG: SDR family oxidoreductase, partial [bacterium]|nr:SDR family oxidoreductase [bacterium]
MGEPVPRFTPYVAAKYALMGFAKCMAIELARFGCRTNMVLPGLTATPLTAGVPPKLFELEAAQNPLGRITTPEDVAAVVAFLVSEDAAYLNGAQISVNGGARIG